VHPCLVRNGFTAEAVLPAKKKKCFSEVPHGTDTTPPSCTSLPDAFPSNAALCSTAVSAHVDLNEENDMSPVTADAVDGCG